MPTPRTVPPVNSTGRDADGRDAEGNPGGPGRPPGSRNRSATLLDALVKEMRRRSRTAAGRRAKDFEKRLAKLEEKAAEKKSAEGQ